MYSLCNLVFSLICDHFPLLRSTTLHPTGWCWWWCFVWTVQLKSMYSFQASTGESTLTMGVNTPLVCSVKNPHETMKSAHRETPLNNTTWIFWINSILDRVSECLDISELQMRLLIKARITLSTLSLWKQPETSCLLFLPKKVFFTSR